MSDRDRESLERVARYLIDVSELEGDPTPVGPFTVYVSRVTRADWGTYAIPTGRLEGAWRDDLARVIDIFRQQGRRGSFDYVAELYPDLQAEVVGRGFTKVDVEPLLVLDGGSRLAVVEGVDVHRVEADEPALGRILEIIRIAFEEDEETTDQAVEERRQMLKADNKVMLMAQVDGEPVAAGTVTHVGGVAEITGIATRASHRGRGIASAITSELARIALGAGCELVYLTARDDDAARIYRRLGFTRVGTYIEAGKPKE